MSAATTCVQKYNYKCILFVFFFILMIGFVGVASAEPAPKNPSSDTTPVLPSFDHGDGRTTFEDLHHHASTITEILDKASERVEQLASAEAGPSEMVDAIRHELTLSRRWNQHLETILLDVAEARLALKAREREAAKEIARMTAIAEEARLELMTLRNALTDDPKKERDDEAGWSEGRIDDGRPQVTAGRIASARQLSIGREDVELSHRHLNDVRERLSSLEQAHDAVADDVDAVRSRIIDALRTLAASHGQLPLQPSQAGPALSSQAITGWAASIATKLDRHRGQTAP